MGNGNSAGPRPDGHWPLRFLSVAIAVVLWLVYSYADREQSLLERAFNEVNVTYETPDGFILLNPVSTVALRVSGPEDAIQGLQPFDLGCTLTLVAEAGIQEVLLEEDCVSRPARVSVTSLTPDRLSLEIDREIEKTLTVYVDPVGEPAAGALEGEHGVFPAQVTLVGPARLLERRDRIAATVDIDGRARSFDGEVSLDPEDPLLRILGSSTARVQIVLETPLLPSEAVNSANGAAAEAQ
ncbi:MAG: CdaR family protein [Acidobacteriota bacterium]|nr:CdaR family protein [Acidobacteriota bacterium]